MYRLEDNTKTDLTETKKENVERTHLALNEPFSSKQCGERPD
jgi:hypothetical protein